MFKIGSKVKYNKLRVPYDSYFADFKGVCVGAEQNGLIPVKWNGCKKFFPEIEYIKDLDLIIKVSRKELRK